MGDTVILSAEASAAISRVRKAEEELNAAVRALPDDIEAKFTNVEYRTIEMPIDRDILCVNLRKRL